MSDEATAKPSLRHKAVEEFKELLALTAYLYVCLGALTLLKSAILQEVGISFDLWGIAIVKALVLAKFMLLGRAAKLGRIPLSAADLAEPPDGPDVPASPAGSDHPGGSSGRPDPWQATCRLADPRRRPDPLHRFCHVLRHVPVLVPYCAFRTLGGVIGDDYLVRMFFIERIDKPG